MLEPWRAIAAARVAEVAPGPVPTDDAADAVTRVAAVLAQLPPERRDLPRAVEGAVCVRPLLEDRLPQVLGASSRERCPARPDRVESVGVAASDRREAVVRGER